MKLMTTEDGVPGVNPKLDAMCETLKTIHDLNERNKTLEEQLTKAKEIIEKLISDNRKVWVYSSVRAEAEQFLREVIND